MSKRDGRKNDAGETAVMESPAVESDRSVETASSLSSTVTEVDKYPSPGKVIRKFRELRGIRQIEMAHAMGHRTAEWAGMIENGYRALDLDKAPQMAAVLQINAKDFTQHCLFEYYPKAAAALFAEPQDPNAIHDEAGRKPSPVVLQPATYELALALETLPATVQEAIMHLVVNLRQTYREGVRDRDARPFGRPISVRRET